MSTVRRVLMQLMCVLTMVTAAQISGAQPDIVMSPQDIEERVDGILSKPPFRTGKTVNQWRYRGSFDTDDEPRDPEWFSFFRLLSQYLGAVTEILLWALVVAAIVCLVVFRHRWMRLFSRRPAAPEIKLPSALFGHEEASQPLPEDIAGTAWRLWKEGSTRAALSLLYRGALVHLITTRQLELPDSATEEDCLRIVIPSESAELGEYFRNLTRTWQRRAYAASAPADEVALGLCESWRVHFGVPA